MKNIGGRTVLLTGGSRGIGPYIAEEFARHGASLALAARSKDDLRKVADSLKSHQTEVQVFPADLSRSTQREQLVQSMLEYFGGIDILVNNAGIGSESSFLKQSDEIIQSTIEVNMTAPIHLTALTLPSMIKQGSGHVVNISSIAGKKGAPYAAVYSGTKAGISEWTHGLRIELENTGIRFSVIYPGFVEQAGLFARFGVDPPKSLGSCTPGQVAKAVIKAVRKNKREIIVNSNPLRPLLVMIALSPRLGDWILKILGITEFQRRKVGE